MMRWSDTMGLEDPRATVASSRRAGGRAAAVSVVAVGQAHGRAVAGDVVGIACNA